MIMSTNIFNKKIENISVCDIHIDLLYTKIYFSLCNDGSFASNDDANDGGEWSTPAEINGGVGHG